VWHYKSRSFPTHPSGGLISPQLSHNTPPASGGKERGERKGGEREGERRRERKGPPRVG